MADRRLAGCYDVDSPAHLAYYHVAFRSPLPHPTFRRPCAGYRNTWRVAEDAVCRRGPVEKRRTALVKHRRGRVTRSSAAEAEPTQPAASVHPCGVSLPHTRLCFVGMSNCGKSHWSSRLHQELGYELLCVDDEIERAIGVELTRLGYAGIAGMAKWMGLPTDERFAVNQARYLSYEEGITARACRALAAPGAGRCVLDTTGSVIYLSDGTLKEITDNFLVVHLEASDDMISEMIEQFFAVPKPVVWGDVFDWRAGEEAEAALRRCYPNLLKDRRARYARLADVTIPSSLSACREATLDDICAVIRASPGF